jgi:alpha-1,2-mannosyltransferase
LDKHADEQATEPAPFPKKSGNNRVKLQSKKWLRFLLAAILLLIRVQAAEIANITDCDEVYNYWEPLHFLLHESGMQTWEYSPVYALRSYAYLLLFKSPVLLCRLFGFSLCRHKTGEFYLIRLVNALVCWLAEVWFARGLEEHFASCTLGNLYLLFATTSAGMFYSSPSVLPSSFAMVQILLAYSCWIYGRDMLTILFFANGAILGWPFVGLLALPLAYRMLTRQPVTRLLQYGGFVLIVLSLLLYTTDSYFYGRRVFTPLRLVMYNIFPTEGKGPDIFGREPWFYYLLNGNLNFPVFFVIAMAYAVFVAITRTAEMLVSSRIIRVPVSERTGTDVAFAYSFLLWLLVFSSQSHKEERFLYPIYPLICYLASQGCARCLLVLGTFRRFSGILVACLVIAGIVANTSRIIGQQYYYSAPALVFAELTKRICGQKICTLCMEKEWHRFPSSFFLPDRFRLRFVPFAGSGLLPKPFESTSDIPSGMNDMNVPVYDDRYVADIASDCDYFIDVFENPSALPEQLRAWTIVIDATFLHRESARSLVRAFYIPKISSKAPRHEYVLLEKKQGRRQV